MAISKSPQRFIPRRDIVVETKLPKPEKKNNPSKPSVIPLTQQLQPVQLLLLIFLLWFTIPAFKNGKNRHFKILKRNLKETFNTPDTIIHMLSDVSPYLGLKEQENINTLVGVLEAANILRNIRVGTYQNPRILRSMNSSMNVQDKKLGIIKALKPYIPSNNHEIVDKAIQTYNTINKVSENLVQYTSKTSENIDRQKIADQIAETLEIINPLVPPEQQQRLKQIQNVIKMYGIMESSQLWEKRNQQESQQIKTQETSNNSSSQKSESKTKEQKNVTDALKSVLSPEQSQAMEVMMKMAQLLSQKSNDYDESKND
jgi:hypothetical protein